MLKDAEIPLANGPSQIRMATCTTPASALIEGYDKEISFPCQVISGSIPDARFSSQNRDCAVATEDKAYSQVAVVGSVLQMASNTDWAHHQTVLPEFSNLDLNVNVPGVDMFKSYFLPEYQ
jgi:hypothetical protein